MPAAENTVVDEAESEDAETSTKTQESETNEEVLETSEETSEETEESKDSDETQEEKWVVPGRFRTHEDVIKSYSELESAFSRRGNELHQLKQQIGRPSIDTKAEIEQFAEAVKKNPVEAVRMIARKEAEEARAEAQSVRFETEYSRLMQNEEFRSLEPVMSQIATQYEDLIKANGSANDPRLLHILFYAARGVKTDEAARKAEKRGVRKGERTAVKKGKAQIEGASGTKGPSTVNIDKMSAAEMREAFRNGKIDPKK
jgi:hypothetical protein